MDDKEFCLVCGKEATWFTSKVWKGEDGRPVLFKQATKYYYCDKHKKEKEMTDKTCEFCMEVKDSCLKVDFQMNLAKSEDDADIMIKVKKCVCDDCLAAIEMIETTEV